VTDRATGPHDTKPAQWVDANIHATEVTGSVAALHLLHHLVRGFGADEDVTRALRTRTFYVVPRVNPDGAELALADHPRLLRSSVRRWPWQDGHVPPGLDEGDVDGDGRILTMRFPDPHGAWRPHPEEPRLLTRRGPDEPGGDGCYRLLRRMAAGPRRLHHPDARRGKASTSTATSRPVGVRRCRDRATTRARSRDPGADGRRRRAERVRLQRLPHVGRRPPRPSSTRPDRELPPVDVRTWTQLGRRCTELTTYPVHSIYEDFTWDPSR
jgi:hypothetical protein